MKTAEEILENNSLIAEFMGLEIQEDGTYYDAEVNECIDVENLCYNESWDMLMQVVDKIENMGFSVTIGAGEYCRIGGFFTTSNVGIAIEFAGSKLNCVYSACVAFVKEYNKQIGKL